MAVPAQNFQNHKRYYPLFHFTAVPLLALYAALLDLRARSARRRSPPRRGSCSPLACSRRSSARASWSPRCRTASFASRCRCDWSDVLGAAAAADALAALPAATAHRASLRLGRRASGARRPRAIERAQDERGREAGDSRVAAGLPARMTLRERSRARGRALRALGRPRSHRCAPRRATSSCSAPQEKWARRSRAWRDAHSSRSAAHDRVIAVSRFSSAARGAVAATTRGVDTIRSDLARSRSRWRRSPTRPT